MKETEEGEGSGSDRWGWIVSWSNQGRPLG